jgi:hypothetical protein
MHFLSLPPPAIPKNQKKGSFRQIPLEVEQLFDTIVWSRRLKQVFHSSGAFALWFPEIFS